MTQNFSRWTKFILQRGMPMCLWGARDRMLWCVSRGHPKVSGTQGWRQLDHVAWCIELNVMMGGEDLSEEVGPWQCALEGSVSLLPGCFRPASHCRAMSSFSSATLSAMLPYLGSNWLWTETFLPLNCKCWSIMSQWEQSNIQRWHTLSWSPKSPLRTQNSWS